MRAVNILFNHKTSSGFQRIAGVENIFLSYSQLLIKNGFEVISIAKPNMSYRQNLLDMGSKIYEINALGHGDVITMIRLAFLFLRFRPDIIICHSGRAFFMIRLAAFIFRIPTLAINHGTKAEKFIKADYIFSVNSSAAGQLIKLGKDKNKSLVIPNMLEIPDDFTEPKNKKLHSPIRIGSLGRLGVEKQYSLVVKALSILKSQGIMAEFFLAGDGADKPNIEKIIKELHLENQVKFLGWISDKKSFFESIDIFVLPSWEETFGIVLLEAMLYKTPVITGDSYGPSDIFENEIDGLIIPTHKQNANPELLADAVKKLIDNWEAAQNMADKAYKKFHQKYSAEVVNTKIMDLIYKIIQKS